MAEPEHIDNNVVNTAIEYNNLTILIVLPSLVSKKKKKNRFSKRKTVHFLLIMKNCRDVQSTTFLSHLNFLFKYGTMKKLNNSVDLIFF